jgi:hypothetical protein
MEEAKERRREEKSGDAREKSICNVSPSSAIRAGTD